MNEQIEEPDFLTVSEVAARYRTSPKTIYDWIYRNVAPPSMRIGKRRLFRKSDLIDWEETHREEQDREQTKQRWKGVA